MTWTGTLRFVDVGTGAWRLELDGGGVVGLYGEIPAALSDCRVLVRGHILDGAGIGMVGGALVQVASVEAC
jgi:hypothetical protein